MRFLAILFYSFLCFAQDNEMQEKYSTTPFLPLCTTHFIFLSASEMPCIYKTTIEKPSPLLSEEELYHYLNTLYKKATSFKRDHDQTDACLWEMTRNLLSKERVSSLNKKELHIEAYTKEILKTKLQNEITESSLFIIHKCIIYLYLSHLIEWDRKTTLQHLIETINETY